MYAIILLLLLLLQGNLSAAQWYADADASDINACTVGAPCKTVRKLVERDLAPGDTLNLQCGDVYRETSTPINPQTNSPGTSGARITLQSYGSCYEKRGVHEGSSGATVLTDVGANFVALGVQPEHRVFNLTKAAHCYVGSVTADTITCARPVSHTLEVTWSAGDRYVVDNKPIVTHASVLNVAGNWSCTGGICQHALAEHAGRHVWINGQSTHPMMHTGTCSQSGMNSASDGQYCTICNSGTGRNCGASKIYIKTATNPATRWTTPGVEVVQTQYAQNIYNQGTVPYWTIKNVAFEKAYGLLIGSSASNLTLDNIRGGWSQRKNCVQAPTATYKCWGNNDYTWQHGQDNRGSEIFKISALSGDTKTGNFVLNSLFHDAENNGMSLSGTGSITATIRNTEFFNNEHSMLNTGLSSSSAGSRNVTLEYNTFHSMTTAWHSGGATATHTATVRNNLFYDMWKSGDQRAFIIWEPGSTYPFGIYLADPGTYTHTNNIVIDGGSGYRLAKGTHIMTENIIQGNTVAGINASGSAKIKLNNNIIADNGGSVVNGASFQIGCSKTPCNNTLFSQVSGQSVSNNNKFRPPSGTNIAYMGGQSPAAKSLSQWQSISGGDTSSVTTDDCFVNATGNVGTRDYNLATNCDDIIPKRGPFREITYSSGAMQGSTLNAVWNIGGTQPVSRCDGTKATVTYNTVGQTEGTCTPNVPVANQTSLAIASAPAAGATVELSGAYALLEDSMCIGGANGACWNARSRVFTPQPVTSVGGVPATGWVKGSERSIPSGSNRVLIAALCWEVSPVSSSPISMTSCSYGGQPMTLVQNTTAVDSSEPLNISNVHASIWRLNEIDIAAATNTSFVCNTSESPNGGRPYILYSGVYAGLNQTTPVLNVSQTATLLDGTPDTAVNIQTNNMTSTGDPGVPVQLACSGNEGSYTPGPGWTEHVDDCEDGTCGTRMHVADRTSAGQTNIHGEVTFGHGQTFSERLALIAIALNGGTVLPPEGIPLRTQTASRCAFHNAPGWQAPQDGVCTIVPGHQLAVVGEYTVTDAAESVPIGKQLNCCWGNCEDPSNFFPVDGSGENGVRYASSGLFPHGMEITDRLLTGAACTHVPGAFITQDSMVAQALSPGQCSTFGYIIEVMSSVNPVATPVLTCAMALDDNTPFALGARTIINIKNGKAVGQ